MDCSTPGSSVLHHLQELAQIQVHWVDDAIQPSHPLLSPSPSTLNHSQHQVSSNESVLCIRWPKYQSFSFSISPSNEYSGSISFKMDWLDHLAVQATLKSLLQHHSFKASSLLGSAFFMSLVTDHWHLVKRLLTADTCRQGLGALRSMEDWARRALCGSVVEAHTPLAGSPQRLQMPDDHRCVGFYLSWGNILRLSLLLINRMWSSYDER